MPDLLDAWVAWEQKGAKGDHTRAGEMEDACTAAAAELGCTPNEFREALTAYRRRGMGREQVLNHLVGDQPTEP